MSIIKLASNLSEMAEYEPLPDGLYSAELQDVDHKINEKNPEGFFTITYRISPDDFPADYDAGNAPEGLQVTQGFLALPSATNRRTVRPFKSFLTALGVSTDLDTVDPEEWIGKNVQILLTRSSFQGSLINNVDGVSPLPSV